MDAQEAELLFLPVFPCDQASHSTKDIHAFYFCCSLVCRWDGVKTGRGRIRREENPAPASAVAETGTSQDGEGCLAHLNSWGRRPLP